jgi:putative transposase
MEDSNTAGPHFSFGYQTPAAFAGTIAATDYNVAPIEAPSRLSPVAQLLNPCPTA